MARRTESLGLTGEEIIDVSDLENGRDKNCHRKCRGCEFEATVRLDTPNEVEYFRNGGILQTVLRNLKKNP